MFLMAICGQDVGFTLLFSDIHLWASIFSVILVNYIFMDGKCDYFQGESDLFILGEGGINFYEGILKRVFLFVGTALVVVYLILLALYFFAPSPRSC